MSDSYETLHHARQRIQQELDDRIGDCTKKGTTRLETILTVFMQECGMSDHDIANHEHLLEIFADYILLRFPLMNLSNQQILNLVEEWSRGLQK